MNRRWAGTGNPGGPCRDSWPDGPRRITRGKIQLREEEVDIAATVDRAVEATSPLMEQRRLTFTVSRHAGLPRLDADPARLEQVLLNLLNNAAKYSDPGGSVRLAVARCGDELTLRVEDTVIGIAPEQLPHIFELFAQADDSLERSRGGLGIGLTLVRLLVERHGGRPEAESPGLGRGSVFTVRLPIPRGAEPGRCVVRPEADRAPGPSLHVLVVDDNHVAADGLVALLSFWGHRTRVAHDGPSGLELALAHRPDVVLLDIGLPGMDGYQVARRLRGHSPTEAPLLIATSGYGGEEDLRRCQEAGFHHHLVKRVDIDLLEKLLSDLEASRRGEE